MRAGGRARLGRAALIVLSTLVALLGAEVALRALGVRPERFAQTIAIEREDKRVALDLYPDDPRGYFPVDLRDERERARWEAEGLALGEAWRRAPHGVPLRFSRELCRGGDVGARREGAARVIAIGDSFTEGQGVREEDTFVARLGRALGGEGAVEVIGCGRRGADFPAISELFERHLALEPDVVVYAMVLNDPERSEAFHARQRFVDDWIVDRRRMVSEGDGAPPSWQPWLFALIDDRLEGMRIGAETTRWYQEMVEAPNAEGWARTIERVAEMDEAMRARGGALVVALWPLFVALDGAYPFARAHETIARALEARGIRFVDTLPAFRGRDPRALWAHPADRHPNDEAHAIFAHAIEPTVRSALRDR